MVSPRLLGTFTRGDSQRILTDKDAQSVPLRSVHNKVDNRRWSLIGELSYERAFSERFNLSLGGQSLVSHSRNAYFEGSTIDRLNENIHYLFASASGRLGSFSSSFKIFGVKNNKDRHTDWVNQTNASLMYNLDKSNSLRYTASYMP